MDSIQTSGGAYLRVNATVMLFGYSESNNYLTSICYSGNSEICQPNITLAVDQYVLRLEISMND